MVKTIIIKNLKRHGHEYIRRLVRRKALLAELDED